MFEAKQSFSLPLYAPHSVSKPSFGTYHYKHKKAKKEAFNEAYNHDGLQVTLGFFVDSHNTKHSCIYIHLPCFYFYFLW